MGHNWSGSVISCYATGPVSGGGIGGLVGYIGRSSECTMSFWDIETSNQRESNGGTGLLTTQMQDINTYLDAGWDFVDEATNGTDDIWWMPVSDTPRLWWEVVD